MPLKLATKFSNINLKKITFPHNLTYCIYPTTNSIKLWVLAMKAHFSANC